MGQKESGEKVRKRPFFCGRSRFLPLCILTKAAERKMRRRLDSEKNTKSRKMITLCIIVPLGKKRKETIDKGGRTWYNDARGNYTCRFFAGIAQSVHPPQRACNRATAAGGSWRDAEQLMLQEKNYYAGIAQSVEQLIRNQQVACSSHVSSSNPRQDLLTGIFPFRCMIFRLCRRKEFDTMHLKNCAGPSAREGEL